MSTGQKGHVDQPLLLALRPPSTHRLQVQHAQSRDTVTFHFSALGKEDEEEPLYGATVDDSEEAVAALEARELLVLGQNGTNSATDDATPLCTVESTTLSSISSQQNTCNQDEASAMAMAGLGPPTTTNSSPFKLLSLPSMDKAFLNFMKSLSSEAEPREGIPVAFSMRHRQLMKNLVKSCSMETTQDCTGSDCSPDTWLNLPLFKQFTQPRTSVGDSKTAPSSPLTSTDNRTFSFKVSEVEARIEDTKRRLSEVISDPIHLISKLIGDESTSLYRPKALSSSASELGTLSTFNGHIESNNNYSIIEEEGDVKDKCTFPGAADLASASNSKTIKPNSLSLDLKKFSMSALVKQEDEEFCELYSDDFKSCTDTEGDGHHTDYTNFPASRSVDTFSKIDLDIKAAPSIPHKTLLTLTILVYGYFLLPLPSYLGGMLLGAALGFMLAIGAVWLAGPKQPGSAGRHHKKLWGMGYLDIKEPEIFKGWMNEIQTYDPETYHATLTYSVFVHLEGSTLRLSKPNKNIPRRASYNEPKLDVTYISQRIYDVTNSKVFLVPQSLARKRIWNKKYPICIELGKQEDFMSKAEGKNSVNSEEKEKEELSVSLYLFGRTGREKEEWFRRILLASKQKSKVAKKVSSLPGCKTTLPLSHSRNSSRGSLDEFLLSQPNNSVNAKHEPLMDYSSYMVNYISQAASSLAASPAQSPHGSPGLGKKLQNTLVNEDGSVSWLNAFVGRIAWNFLRETHWSDLVSKKIQMKLSKIRLPYFMNELRLTELDMGDCTPRILQASQPSVDHQGLWFDLEIIYKGSFLMTLETKMNLVRLGKEGEEGSRPRTYCLANSDEESSSAGSSDEEEMTENDPEKGNTSGVEGYTSVHKPGKIMRFVDKIIRNKYFQKATETEFIKKKMEEVSNTPLLLTVELQECRGTLAVNVPPPPTDRIWYGFRSPPHLELKARPKLGERVVTLVPVTDWIEKKLDQEFQKLLVMPNMDDIWLHIMHSAMDPRSGMSLSDAKSEQNPSETEFSSSEEA